MIIRVILTNVCKISFHEQSDRVSFLEGKVFQYGWIFLPFSFFLQKIGRSLYIPS